MILAGPAALGLALSGAGAGLLGAVLGIGGGVFLVPVLVLFFDAPMTHAVGTGLIAVIATSSAVASVNVERGLANMRLGMVLETATVLGALAGALAAQTAAPQALMALFAFVQAGLSVVMWRGSASAADEGPPQERKIGRLGARYHDPAERREVSYRVRRLPAGLAASFAAGGLSGLLGIGGGFLKVPVLHLYCRVPMKAAAATSNFMIGVTAAASAFLYSLRGAVDPAPTACVVLGVLGGSAAGTWLNVRLKDLWVRRAFAVLLAVLSVQMARRALHG